jgi:hypothetical protein
MDYLRRLLLALHHQAARICRAIADEIATFQRSGVGPELEHNFLRTGNSALSLGAQKPART